MLGVVELSVIGFVVIVVGVGVWMVRRLALLREIRQLEAGLTPPPTRERGLKETFKAALGKVDPGQLPLDMLPLRDVHEEVAQAHDRLAIRVRVEEQVASTQGWSDAVCRITLEIDGGRWPLELVSSGAAWRLKPDSGDPVASFQARGHVEHAGDRRRILAALAALMGLGEAPPSLEGDDEEAGELEVEHWGQQEVEGGRREVVCLKFAGLELYPLWVMWSRAEGVGEVLVSAEREERPLALIGAELAMRGLRAHDMAHDTPQLVARPVWAPQLTPVAGTSELDASRWDGFCCGGAEHEELSLVYRGDDHLRILRWAGLDREPQEVWRGELESLESARWSAQGARVCLRYEEVGGPRFDLFDMTTRRLSHDVLKTSKEDLDMWEIEVADKWPLIVYYDFLIVEDEAEDGAYVVHVVDDSGEEVWRWVLREDVEDVEMLWTDRGLLLTLELEEGEREVWLWHPDNGLRSSPSGHVAPLHALPAAAAPDNGLRSSPSGRLASRARGREADASEASDGWKAPSEQIIQRDALPAAAPPERLSAVEEAGSVEGRDVAAVRAGYGVAFVDAQGQERARWTPGCVDELDALYFWSPSDHIWAGDVVFLDDTMWSAVDTRSGQSRLLCGEDVASGLETVLAGGPGWVVVQHDELGVAWGRLEGAEGAVSGLWGGDAGGGSAW